MYMYMPTNLTLIVVQVKHVTYKIRHTSQNSLHVTRNVSKYVDVTS